MNALRSALLRIRSLVQKEMLALLRDPRSRVILVLPPLLQSILFGYAATFDLNHAPYALFDQDRSAASQDLAARLDGSGVFERVANVLQPADFAKLIDDRSALLAIVIPPDFAAKISGGGQAKIQVIVDGRNSNTAGTALGYISTIVDSFNADWRRTHGIAEPAISVSVRAWYNANLETSWNMIPGLIGTITLLQVLLLTALSVAREREDGTFDQLLVTPFRPSEIMIGKALPSTIVGLIQATIIFLVAELWFRIPFAGSLVTLYSGLLAVRHRGGRASACSSRRWCRRCSRRCCSPSSCLMPFILLSGLTTPIGNMPQIFQFITFIDPLRYAIDITRRVYLEGRGACATSSATCGRWS